MELVTYTMARLGGCKHVTREDIWDLGEELLNWQWSSRERGTAEGRLRGRRGVEDDGLGAVGMDHLGTLYVD